MNSMPKHVASTTLRDPVWNATVLEGDVVNAVAGLKEDDGGPILVAGSRTLLHTLTSSPASSTSSVSCSSPVAIGAGLRVFPSDDRQRLSWKLVDRR